MKIVRPSSIRSMGTSDDGSDGGATATSTEKTASNFRRQLPRRAYSQRFERSQVEISDDDLAMESDESQ